MRGDYNRHMTQECRFSLHDQATFQDNLTRTRCLLRFSSVNQCRVCCVRSKEDTVFYRGRIVRISDATLQVVLVDFGSTKDQHNNDILEVRTESIEFSE